MKRNWRALTLLGVLAGGGGAVAEELGAVDVGDLSLDELLNTEVEVATRSTATTPRETPGVVSILTREELIRAGARDLLDALRLVPGFEFGVDVTGVVGVGFRGNWGHEGKVLLLIDGQEMNENLYSTLQFGNHYLTHNIQRIEIIRGPGSAVYGGSAELAVINVITVGAEDLKGARVSTQLSRQQGGSYRRSLGLALGHTVGDVQLSVSGYVGEGDRSTRDYFDSVGDSYRMAGASPQRPRMVNAGLKYKGLGLRLILDSHHTRSQDGYDVIDTVPLQVDFNSLHADARYEAKLGESFTLTPRFTYRRQEPWRGVEPNSPSYYDKLVERFTGGLAGSWTPVDGVNLLTGVEAYVDHARVRPPFDVGFQALFGDETETVQYENLAAYSQVLWRNPIVNLTAGARYEHHSVVGDSFVPRVGLTKVVDRFHFKVLYSRAFRAPAVENINVYTPLDADDPENVAPERTTVAEAEVGYQLGDHLFLSGNVFDIRIKDPIVYFYDAVTEEDGYANFSQTGTQGVEFESRAVFSQGSATLTYSFYRTGTRQEVDAYEVAGKRNLMLGFPAHKLGFNGQLRPWRKLVLNPWLVWTSERYGFTAASADVPTRLGATLLANFFVSYEDLFVPGFNLGAGVYNLLDEEVVFVQPYNSGHSPLPDGRREFGARASYRLEF